MPTGGADGQRESKNGSLTSSGSQRITNDAQYRNKELSYPVSRYGFALRSIFSELESSCSNIKCPWFQMHLILGLLTPSICAILIVDNDCRPPCLPCRDLYLFDNLEALFRNFLLFCSIFSLPSRRL